MEVPMLQLIHGQIDQPDPRLPETTLVVERLTLAKRRWRGVAEDGKEFGFELERPLRHGEVFWQTASARYVVRQVPEALLEVSLEIAPSAAAGIGWAVGNLHLELCAEPIRLLALDEPAVRQLLARLQVPFKPVTGIFRPGRFARGQLNPHELGSSHRH
jgi:urease accessory protein